MPASAADPATDEFGAVSPAVKRTVLQFARYCPDEAVCHPSQRLIAEELGVCERTVRRHVRKAVDAELLRVTHQQRGYRNGIRAAWRHNHYEVLASYTVSSLAMKSITRRSHSRSGKKRAQARAVVARNARIADYFLVSRTQAAKKPVNTGVAERAELAEKALEGRGECPCRHCRSDRRRWQPKPPPIRRLEEPEERRRLESSLKTIDRWKETGHPAALRWLV